MHFDPAPSVLWTLRREGNVASCEVLFVPSGVEVRVLRNGSLLLSQTFTSGTPRWSSPRLRRNEPSVPGGDGW